MIEDASRRRQLIAIALAAVVAIAVIVVVLMKDSNSTPSSTRSSPPAPAPETSFDVPRDGEAASTEQSYPPMSTAPPPPSVSTDPAIQPAPVPPVGQAPPETPLPWTDPVPLPADIDGPVDPAATYQAPTLPAALSSSFGQTAYPFITAWSQVYLNRPAWREEWAARWSPYATAQLTASAPSTADDIWAGPRIWGIITYHPVVTAVVVREDGPHNALFEIVVATQGASVTTKQPTMAYAHVKTWQVALTVVNGEPKVSAVVRLDQEEEDIAGTTGQR